MWHNWGIERKMFKINDYIIDENLLLDVISIEFVINIFSDWLVF